MALQQPILTHAHTKCPPVHQIQIKYRDFRKGSWIVLTIYKRAIFAKLLWSSFIFWTTLVPSIMQADGFAISTTGRPFFSTLFIQDWLVCFCKWVIHRRLPMTKAEVQDQGFYNTSLIWDHWRFLLSAWWSYRETYVLEVNCRAFVYWMTCN